MNHDQQLERSNSRIRKSLRYLIKKVHGCAKEIQAEVKIAGTSQASKRVADQAILLEAAALVAETVFKEKEA